MSTSPTSEPATNVAPRRARSVLIVRAGLAALMIVLGATILVRLLAAGLHLETFAGLVLGAAMVALGIHRLALIARLRRTS